MSQQTQNLQPTKALSPSCQKLEIGMATSGYTYSACELTYVGIIPTPSITQHQYQSSFESIDWFEIFEKYTKIFLAPFFHVLLRSKPLAVDDKQLVRAQTITQHQYHSSFESIYFFKTY